MKLSVHQRPFIGILSFLIVLFTMPLGHALMILVEKVLGPTHQFSGAIVLGAMGAAILAIGVGSDKEGKAT